MYKSVIYQYSDDGREEITTHDKIYELEKYIDYMGGESLPWDVIYIMKEPSIDDILDETESKLIKMVVNPNSKYIIIAKGKGRE